MEFLRPLGKTQEIFHYTRVRLAWYYRPSDVTERTVADSRLLLAGMYTEVCDINQIRARCHVVHRDKISDLAGWKKRPDRFYYNRLFDPYMRKELEIIQSTDVRNLPDNIRETLISRYEYVVAEKEVIPDLTDHLRTCDTCSEWCPSLESVRCDRCKLFFHMQCVNPPLMAKPSRGYGWTCAPCSRKHEEEVDSHHTRQHTPATNRPLKSNAPAVRGRGRPRKDKSQQDREENLPIKYFKMWPFRYFGQYTVAEDTLDADDLISPRAPTRVGPKFQATLIEKNAPYPGEHVFRSDRRERGGDSTVEVLSAINILTGAEVELCKQSLTSDLKVSSSIDWLTEVVRRYSEAALAAKSMYSVNMKTITRQEQWKTQPTRYTDREWSREEIGAFEDAIFTHGAQLRAVREEIGTRTMPEVVRFYGHWKNGKIGEENEQLRTNGALPEPQYEQWGSPEEAYQGQTVGPADDESSIVTQPSKAPSCGACRTRESKAWWKAPKGLATNFLCDSCGQNWRKYADLNVRSVREESVPSMKARSAEKREGTPLTGPVTKRPRLSTSSASVVSTPPPPPQSAVQFQCVCCRKSGPIGKVLKCTKCGFRIHAGVCGAVVSPEDVEKWRCDLCSNDENLEASLVMECMLCPRDQLHDKKFGPSSNSVLRACKPTEGQQWAHVICSVFIPELTFSDASRLRLVEGASTIANHRWTSASCFPRCCICHEKGGAVIRCSDCSREYHVSCAWDFGHKFGFEIQPVKSSRRDTTVTTTFRDETGCMNAIISCKDHDHSRRMIYSLCDTTDGGETALQVYCRNYKQATGQSHALLRKARRLDQLLNVRGDVSVSPPRDREAPVFNPDPSCDICHTEFSPAFHLIDDAAQTYRCHRCYFSTQVQPEVNSVVHEASRELVVN
ncbi:uncharacterized protein BT62DRAFT_898517 [Guyanagaster necrorhizus]|uniref:Uncharacterized protein n=1 Tax=Guyanagaster necrorhizus TaxID=856835 RepID=A0A9P7VSE1_9AGAR|nr:uncharacterized protein BT62DRAFT_898517 [Guyanagaster necrorhizus MCA 3950]KAG7445124.1 hypothetical protein BT62DRAFT_898517 [Guyanagaster necrorhizus MCA 3950]